jgi:hypothetical protein
MARRADGQGQSHYPFGYPVPYATDTNHMSHVSLSWLVIDDDVIMTSRGFCLGGEEEGRDHVREGRRGLCGLIREAAIDENPDGSLLGRKERYHVWKKGQS